jgi:hypothetical protein
MAHGELTAATAMLSENIAPVEARYHQLHNEEMRGYLSGLETLNMQEGVSNESKLQRLSAVYNKVDNGQEMHVEKDKSGVSWVVTSDAEGHLVRQVVNDKNTSALMTAAIKFGNDEYRGKQAGMAKTESEARAHNAVADKNDADVENIPEDNTIRRGELAVKQRNANTNAAQVGVQVQGYRGGKQAEAAARAEFNANRAEYAGMTPEQQGSPRGQELQSLMVSHNPRLASNVKGTDSDGNATNTQVFLPANRGNTPNSSHVGVSPDQMAAAQAILAQRMARAGAKP